MPGRRGWTERGENTCAPGCAAPARPYNCIEFHKQDKCSADETNRVDASSGRPAWPWPRNSLRTTDSKKKPQRREMPVNGTDQNLSISSWFCTKLDSHLMFLTLAKASARLPADSLRLRGLRGLVEPERESCRGFHDRSASPIDDERCRTVGVAEAPPPPA